MSARLHTLSNDDIMAAGTFKAFTFIAPGSCERLGGADKTAAGVSAWVLGPRLVFVAYLGKPTEAPIFETLLRR